MEQPVITIIINITSSSPSKPFLLLLLLFLLLPLLPPHSSPPLTIAYIHLAAILRRVFKLASKKDSSTSIAFLFRLI